MVDKESASAERNGIQVIARAGAILRALENEPDGLSLGELASRVTLARSTVQRIVAALLAERFLIPASATSRVKLGPLIIRLGTSANTDIGELVRPHLIELSRSLEETVDLSMLRGRKAVFIDQVSGPNRLAALSSVGDEFPLHCSANGKALLACLAPDRRLALLAGRLVARTPATITDRVRLGAEIEEAARTGVAWDLEEHDEGVSAGGTGFVDGFGRDLSISVPVPTSRFDRKRAAIANGLIETRERILALLT